VTEISSSAILSLGTRRRARLESNSQVQPTSLPWHFVSTWLTIAMLLYLATDGSFITPGSIGTDFNAGAVPSALARFEQTGIWIIGMYLMLPKYKQIFATIKQQPFVFSIMIYATLSVAWSSDKVDSIRRVFLFLLTCGFAAYLYKKYRSEQQMLIMVATAAGAALISLGLVFALPQYGRGSIGEWRGIFGSKADLGMFLCFVFSPYAFLKIKGTFLRVFAFLCLLLAVLEIIMSQSRGAWILTAVLMSFSVAMLILRKLRSIDALLFTALLVLTATAIGLMIYANYAAFTYFIGKDPSLTNRTLIWNAVLTAIRKRPILGYGYGGFWNGLQGESANIIGTIGVFLSHSHDGFLNITLQLGLVGLGLFGLSFVVALRDAFTGIFFRRSQASMWYASILIMIFVGSIDESFLLNYNSLTTILYVMACLGLRDIATRSKTEIDTVHAHLG
jgi:exopolysaccharide production protein ExoQ